MGSLDGGGDFLVTIKSQSLVASPLPNLRIQEEQCLPLSNIDLTLPAVEFSVFFCFRKPETNTFSCMVDVLKKALAQVLEWYCVLSGEMILNSQQEPQVLCNNRGVDFIEAYADVELKHLPLHNPDVGVKGKLVPKNNQGVFCVQVTELKCGGLVVACKFDHRIADAYAGCLFLVSWAEKSKLQPLSRYPSFQRSLLKPRKVANFNDAYLDNMYTPLSMIPPPSSPKQAEHASRIYYITAENISRIQSDANFPGCHNITKLQSFSVYLWQLIAKGVPEGIKKCNMGIVVDGRTRIVSDVKEFKSSPMSSYFGNVISVPYGEMGINELKTKSLPCIAEEVHKFLEVALTPNHFYGVTDWVEAHRPELTFPAIYCKDTKEEVSFVVSSGLRFPFAEVDFGWGKPIFGSCHLAWDAMVGYVMPMQSPSRKGDWMVYMYLLKEQLESLEAEAGDVFRPLTMEYLSSQ